MSISKTERDQWRERLASPYTCFDAAHADFTIRLLDALEEAERELIGRRKECEEVEQVLGKVLGYPPYPVLNGMDYSQVPAVKTNAPDSEWVNIGDHVPGTIAEEAAQRIIDLERKVDWLASQLAMVDSSCPLPENYPCKYHYLDECKTYDGILRTSCWKKAANEVTRKAVEEPCPKN